MEIGFKIYTQEWFNDFKLHIYRNFYLYLT